MAKTGELLCHMHCCENDRGRAGTGSVNWDEVFNGLADVGYDEWITLEFFTTEIKSVAANTALNSPCENNNSPSTSCHPAAHHYPRRGSDAV